MFKALRGCGGGNSCFSGNESNTLTALAQSDFNPPLDARPDLFTPRDYLRPMFGAALYGACISTFFTLPLISVPHPISLMIAMGIASIVIFEMAFIMGMSVFIHHCLFLHRLKQYGPRYYNTEITIDSPAPEAFELCLAATSDLPKSKIVRMDEKNGTIVVALKGNFWVTVDRLVTLRVREVDEEVSVPVNGGEEGPDTGNGSSTAGSAREKSIISIDPSIKLSRARQKMLRMIWGDKWYPLIFRSDISWNRKIIDSVSTYIASVPNWDHKYDPRALEKARYEFKQDVTSDAA
jgi:hypothetical protein